MSETAELWLVILALGIGSFGLRFAFLWPAANGGELDPARLGAAIIALIVSVATGRVILGIMCGLGGLYGLLWLLG